MKTITPQDAAALLRDGATLVDVREADEHARQRIPGARSLPLSRLEDGELAVHAGHPVLFHCRSGARTAGHADRLSAKAGGEAWDEWEGKVRRAKGAAKIIALKVRSGQPFETREFRWNGPATSFEDL